MRRVTLSLPVLVALVSTTEPSLAGETRSAWAWGAAVGSPQLLAATLEKSTGPAMRVQGHVGTVLLLSSAGVRALLLSSRRGIAPYAYAGVGILHTAEGEGGGPLGSTGYGWGGVGVRVPMGGLTGFGEVGVLGGMATSRGYEPGLPGAAVGVVFGRTKDGRHTHEAASRLRAGARSFSAVARSDAETSRLHAGGLACAGHRRLGPDRVGSGFRINPRRTGTRRSWLLGASAGATLPCVGVRCLCAGSPGLRRSREEPGLRRR